MYKSEQPENPFKVGAHLLQMRKEITNLLLRDFGYSREKAEKKVKDMYGGRNFEELTAAQIELYKKTVQRNEAFDKWFVIDERNCIMDCLRKMSEEVFVANSMYPTCAAEYEERRLHQDRAIGQCYRLKQELQYVMGVLPVDKNKYPRFENMIEYQINLLKAWRKSGNKMKTKF